MAEKSFWGEKKDLEWFSNFFFYYGKAIAFFLLLVAIVAVCCISCIKRVEYDCEIYYLSDKHFMTKVFDNVENALTDVVDDIDGKHGKVVEFVDSTAVSKDDVSNDMDLFMNSKNHMQIATGTGYLYIMNEEWYNYCYKGELLEDISEFTGDEQPVYCFEVTDNKFLNDLGVKDNGKLYVGLRLLNNDRLDDKIEISRHNNAKKVLKYIIENK